MPILPPPKTNHQLPTNPPAIDQRPTTDHTPARPTNPSRQSDRRQADQQPTNQSPAIPNPKVIEERAYGPEE